MAETRISRQDLERIILAELRNVPGCEGVADVTVAAIEGRAGGPSWTVTRVDFGLCEGLWCATNLECIMRRMQAQYELADP